MKTRHCPCCNKTLKFKDIWKYGFWGKNHEIRCPYCKSRIKPFKEPTSVTNSILRGFFVIVIPFNFATYLLHFDFLSAVLICVPGFLFLIVFEFILIYRNIQFTKVSLLKQ